MFRLLINNYASHQMGASQFWEEFALFGMNHSVKRCKNTKKRPISAILHEKVCDSSHFSEEI